MKFEILWLPRQKSMPSPLEAQQRRHHRDNIESESMYVTDLWDLTTPKKSTEE